MQDQFKVMSIIDENVTRLPDDIPEEEDKVECCVCEELFARNYMQEYERGYVCKDCSITITIKE